MITPGAGVGDKENPVDAAAKALLDELVDRQEDLRYLQSYMNNNPLGNAYEVSEEAQFNGIDELRDMSRNNYAKLIVDSVVDRLGVLGFKTAAFQDETGDEIAIEAFDRDGMGSKWQEALELSCSYRTSYLLVDPMSKRQKVIPPTNAAVIPDASGEPVAAIVMQRDRALDRDRLTLFYRSVNADTGEADGPAKMFVATRDSASRFSRSYQDVSVTEWDTEIPLNRAIGGDWVWWKQVPVSLDRIPLTVLANKGTASEFESFTDNIDRINHMIFQRVIITTMQAFRQRAVAGNFPRLDPVTGREIDYSEMFTASPAAMWELPEGASIWESSPPGMTDVLEATKADIRDLASLSSTPMERFFPEGNVGTAEGASLSREGYISKVGDRRRRFGAKLARHMAIYFEVIGDKERSNQSLMEVMWEPIQVSSITEQAATLSTLRGAGVPMSTALRHSMGLSPKEIRKVMNEKRMEELTKNLSESINQATPLQRSAQNTGYGSNAVSIQQARENRAKNEPGQDNKLKG